MRTFFAFISLLLLSNFSWAGDVIGNGGGVWSCGDMTRTDHIFLVDFYEAETEWQWPLKNFNHLPSHILVLEALYPQIEQEFPKYGKHWSQRIRSVLPKMNFVEADLEIIEDALYRSRPKASLCENASWEYVQFANYTQFDTVLVQKDIWENPLVSTQEKAGLVVHEAIYEWFRSVFNDKNSVRARYLTGLIFADISATEKNKKLQKLLGNSPVPPSPPPQENGWTCAYSNMLTLRLYLGFEQSRSLSLTTAEKSCLEDEYPNHCSEFPMPCQQATSAVNKWICTQKNLLSDKIFIQKGRTGLEALVHTHNSCVDEDPTIAIHCDEPKCERI